eukprot:jgi/Botrbrau1/2241/Bobra.101_2s0069.1
MFGACGMLQFLRLGRVGYTAIIRNCWEVANYLADEIDKMPFFQPSSLFRPPLWLCREPPPAFREGDEGRGQVLSARAPIPGVPLVTFSLRPEYRSGRKDEFLVADHLRQRGWVVPAYKMARNADDVQVLRVLCREDLSHRGAHDFLEDLERTMRWFENQSAEQTTAKDLDAISTDAIDRPHGGIC